jgi:tetratricopeptide (TPR) repeat protein
MEQGYSQAIADEILNTNYPRATTLAETWLRELPAGAANAEALEAYEIARMFLHRQERLLGLAAGIERGKAFEELLGNLMQVQSVTLVRRAAIMLCHAQIAENYARDFAGQKNYQLQQKDLLQLAYSLLMIANYASAREVLAFIIANHPTQAAAHYFAAHAANMTGNETAFFEHYREALYLRPEVVSEYPEFMPGGVFRDMFRIVQEEEYGEGVRERIYALLLEVNGVYRHRRKLKTDEVRNLESEYRKLRQEYATARAHKKAFEPRLLQLLAMLVIHAHQTQNFEKFEQYRGEMVSIDHSIWQTFQQNNLTQNNQ